MEKNKKFSSWKKTVAGVSLAIALISPTTLISSNSVQASPLIANSSSTTSSQKADAIINFAESLIGKVHYQYGSNNPNNLTFDCSSFTKYVFKSQGINLIWGAGKQASQGAHVAKANLKKGDLVHFSVGTPGKIGHVGIYIGNGKFIHNLKPGSNVLISDLNSGYWKNHYITATRILK
jgi:lipoprotein Spr